MISSRQSSGDLELLLKRENGAVRISDGREKRRCKECVGAQQVRPLQPLFLSPRVFLLGLQDTPTRSQRARGGSRTAWGLQEKEAAAKAAKDAANPPRSKGAGGASVFGTGAARGGKSTAASFHAAMASARPSLPACTRAGP